MSVRYIHRFYHCRSFSQAMMIRNTGPKAAYRLLEFVNASPTPFHAVDAASKRLDSAGFKKACPTKLEDWNSDLLNILADQGSRLLGEHTGSRREILHYSVRRNIS